MRRTQGRKASTTHRENGDDIGLLGDLMGSRGARFKKPPYALPPAPAPPVVAVTCKGGLAGGAGAVPMLTSHGPAAAFPALPPLAVQEARPQLHSRSGASRVRWEAGHRPGPCACNEPGPRSGPWEHSFHPQLGMPGLCIFTEWGLALCASEYVLNEDLAVFTETKSKGSVWNPRRHAGGEGCWGPGPPCAGGRAAAGSPLPSSHQAGFQRCSAGASWGRCAASSQDFP